MFQDTYSSLNPRMPVGAIVREPLIIQCIFSRPRSLSRSRRCWTRSASPSVIEPYPHEFPAASASASAWPELSRSTLVCSSPTSRSPLSTCRSVADPEPDEASAGDHDLSYLVISHDLSVVRYMADRIGVMYLGKLVEIGTVADVYQRPPTRTRPRCSARSRAEPAHSGRGRRIGRAAVRSTRLRLPFRPAARGPGSAPARPPRARSARHLATCHFPLQPNAVGQVRAAGAR